MVRDTPISPIPIEAALDVAVSRAPRLALPVGLAERIVAHATAQPQFASDPDLNPAGTPDKVPLSGQVIPLVPASKISEVAPQRKRGLIVGGGFATLAASLAAVMVIAQAGPETSVVPMAPHSVAVAAGSEVRLDAPEAQAKPPKRYLAGAAAATTPAARTDKAATQIASEPPQPASTPAQVAAPVAAQLATSAERLPREVAGPVVDPTSAPRVVPNGGLMGPPAPQQGWAFTGGSPGTQQNLPGGQPMPSPPPPHGGHH